MVKRKSRRVYVLNLPRAVPLDTLYEKIESATGACYARISVEENKLVIELFGTEYDMKMAWYKIRKALAELWELQRFNEEKKIQIETIVKEIKSTFPPKFLVESLKLRGYQSYIQENILYTTAPLSTIFDTASALSKYLRDERIRWASTSTKRVIACIAAGMNIDLSEIIEVGKVLGLIDEDDKGRIRLTKDWRTTLKIIVDHLKKEENKGKRHWQI